MRLPPDRSRSASGSNRANATAIEWLGCPEALRIRNHVAIEPLRHHALETCSRQRLAAHSNGHAHDLWRRYHGTRNLRLRLTIARLLLRIDWLEHLPDFPPDHIDKLIARCARRGEKAILQAAIARRRSAGPDPDDGEELDRMIVVRLNDAHRWVSTWQPRNEEEADYQARDRLWLLCHGTAIGNDKPTR